jgi:ATP-dependent DNA helicase RecQ
MSDTSAHRIRLILDHLINEGFLQQEEGEYPVITLGRAQSLLSKEGRVLMKLPQDREKPTEPKMPRQTGEKVFVTQNLSGGEPHKLSSATLASTHPAEQTNNIDDTLFDKLRQLRKEIAAKESVPAYIVFSDASLKDMCRKKPVSLAQFSGVNGVGSVKLEKYGTAFINLIREYFKEN